ncbi:hypothetical protein PR202_gb13648 [Eleusine coracana subsp. coracana]|uniref:Uncharacterized protein n=1 Tax=Eleusine coracana subsp. coracana TaxID=191504 RepID=A0AAV5ET54_ELECO|nr:hypothetical protein PR202_gb13648 [Eleusine coracana subsp. coracana]
MIVALGLESGPGRGRKGRLKSSGSGNMEESLTRVRGLVWCFPMPPIPIVLKRSFHFLLAFYVAVYVDKAKLRTYLDDLNLRCRLMWNSGLAIPLLHLLLCSTSAATQSSAAPCIGVDREEAEAGAKEEKGGGGGGVGWSFARPARRRTTAAAEDRQPGGPQSRTRRESRARARRLALPYGRIRSPCNFPRRAARWPETLSGAACPGTERLLHQSPFVIGGRTLQVRDRCSKVLDKMWSFLSPAHSPDRYRLVLHHVLVRWVLSLFTELRYSRKIPECTTGPYIPQSLVLFSIPSFLLMSTRIVALGVESEPGSGRKRGSKSSGSGNIEENLARGRGLVRCFPVPPIPIVLKRSFHFLWLSIWLFK